LTSDKSAILDRASSQINRVHLLTHIHHFWKFDDNRPGHSRVIKQNSEIWPLISRQFWIEVIYLLISINPENLTSIGQSVLELLSKIAKFDQIWIGHYHITIQLIYVLISITSGNLKSIGQSVLKLSCKQESSSSNQVPFSFYGLGAWAIASCMLHLLSR